MKNNIPYQNEILDGGGTDTAAIQSSCGGIPVGCISLALRYMHTPIEMVDIRDMDNSVRLLNAMLEKEKLPIN